MIEAKVIADSLSPAGKRITTLQLRYQRFVHSELMTHRAFSRSAMSSRAIPIAKMIAQVRDDPAMPIHWGANQAGMQAEKELQGVQREAAVAAWREAAKEAARHATVLADIGLHKQVVNRILEPFQWMHTVVTSTEWDNFFELRYHPDAQPEMRALACAMRDAMQASDPEPLGLWEAHLPYIRPDERTQHSTTKLCQISAARCARVSYLKHDGTQPSVEDDLKLFDRLAKARPIHASPLEHQAFAMDEPEIASRNFRGWKQFREMYEGTLR